MDFEIPEELQAYLQELDDFIEREIKPLQASTGTRWRAVGSHFRYFARLLHFVPNARWAQPPTIPKVSS